MVGCPPCTSHELQVGQYEIFAAWVLLLGNWFLSLPFCNPLRLCCVHRREDRRTGSPGALRDSNSRMRKGRRQWVLGAGGKDSCSCSQDLERAN